MKKKLNILLVEDDKDDQEFFMDALEQLKCTAACHISQNGAEAMAKLQDGFYVPDIIFLDINMPKMNGIECLSELGNNSVLKNIPVVMYSSEIEKIATVRALGAKAFVNKLANETELRAKIEAMINLNFTTGNAIANQTFITAKGNS